MKNPDNDYDLEDLEFIDARLIAVERDIEDILLRLDILEKQQKVGID